MTADNLVIGIWFREPRGGVRSHEAVHACMHVQTQRQCVCVGSVPRPESEPLTIAAHTSICSHGACCVYVYRCMGVSCALRTLDAC